jgi:Spy/CpxP family protein refolding chaperone
MKTSRSTRNSVFMLATAAMLQTIPTTQAQPNPDGKEQPQERLRQPYGEGRMNQRRQEGGLPGFQRGTQQGGPGINFMERILTEDQRESMRQTFDANREKTRATMEKIKDARKDLNKAAFGEEFNEKNVHAKALEVAKLEAELTVARLKTLAEIQPALSQEQLDKIMNPPQMQPQQSGNADRENTRPGNRRPNSPPSSPGDDLEKPQQPKSERQ